MIHLICLSPYNVLNSLKSLELTLWGGVNGFSPFLPAGKVVYAETTTAHTTLTGLHYYHQDWSHAAAYVTVPPLRLDTNTSAYLMSLLAK